MTSLPSIRCIIVDDEPLAVSLLADYVRKTPDLDIVLSTTHVLEALQAVQEGKADLLFLDIQMPELTGLQFMKVIRKRCKVILTTAYTQYALEGYEHDVVDYLLKPITLDRFLIAVQKVRERSGISQDPSPGSMQAGAPAMAMQEIPPAAAMQGISQKQAMPEGAGEGARAIHHIFIKTEHRIQKVNLADILYIEALRDYIAIHTATAKILSLDSMKNMEEVLPAAQFIRIHKSYIINREYIDFIERGRVVIHKEYLPIGETYREKLLRKLGL